MKKTVSMALSLLVVGSVLLTGCGGKVEEDSQSPGDSGADAAKTSTEGNNNDDLLAEGIGKDYGLGPVGFDLDTLVERMGDDISNLTIGVSSSSLGSPWIIDWCDEFEKLSEEYGFELVMLNGSNDNDPAQQVSDLKSLQTQDVDGVCLYTEFPDAVKLTLNELYNAEIPVIDSVAPTDEMKVAGWVNVSQVEKGVAMAKQLAEDFGEEDANILVTDIASDLPTLRDRMEGFLDEIKNYPNLHLIEERRDDTADGFVNMTKESVLSNEEINAIFTTFGTGTVYCQNAVEQLGRNDIKIYGVDAEEAALKLLKEGKMAGLQAQWSRVNAALCLFQCLRTVNGDDCEPEVWEPDAYALCVATPEDAQQYLEWFYPAD